MIEILKTRKDFVQFHAQNNRHSLGFVPTMGNLHDGHISLLQKSLEENEVSVISIFVNPTQFAANEDLSSYPRTFEQDLDKIQKLQNHHPSKKIIVFYPENEKVIYPDGFSDYVSLDGLKHILEGEMRPTHFDGVATVVKQLFLIVKPTIAYFGKKDYQQIKVIEQMLKMEQLPVKISAMPIIRELSGLAMSSRNGYLNQKQKDDALVLFKKLNEITKNLKEKGLNDSLALIKNIKDQNPNFNYLEIRSQNDLKIPMPSDKQLVVLGNYQAGNTRLLDNIEVNL